VRLGEENEELAPNVHFNAHLFDMWAPKPKKNKK